jgi:hypothetical protein
VSAPYGLTVGQLKALLDSMPESFDDRIVVLASDPEGNSFDTLSAVAVGWLRNYDEDDFQGRSCADDETWEQVEQQVTRDYLTDEDPNVVEPLLLDENDHPAVCLWP